VTKELFSLIATKGPIAFLIGGMLQFLVTTRERLQKTHREGEQKRRKLEKMGKRSSGLAAAVGKLVDEVVRRSRRCTR
jgi:hypothetical protein